MAYQRPTLTIEARTKTNVRFAVGLVAIGLGFISLSLAIAIFASPEATNLLTVLPNTTEPSPSTANTISITWSTPLSLDGLLYQSFDMRYSTNPITEDNFSQAVVVPNLPVPDEAGTQHKILIKNLQPSTTYYVAWRTVDQAGQPSLLRQVTSRVTVATDEACQPNYQCTDWQGCDNGSRDRYCNPTGDCQSDLSQPLDEQRCVSGSENQLSITPKTKSPAIPLALSDGQVFLLNATDRSYHTIRSADGLGQPSAASGDINNDGVDEIIVGTTAQASSRVIVYSPFGQSMANWQPYSATQPGGIQIASADVNGDGSDEIVTIPSGSSDQLNIYRWNEFNQPELLTSRYLYQGDYRSSFDLTTTDIDGDGRAEIITAPRLVNGPISVWSLGSDNSLKLVSQFVLSDSDRITGWRISAGDVYGTGLPVLLAQPQGRLTPIVWVTDITGQILDSFQPTTTVDDRPIKIQTLDANQNGRAEAIVLIGDVTLKIVEYDGLAEQFITRSIDNIITDNHQQFDQSL